MRRDFQQPNAWPHYPEGKYKLPQLDLPNSTWPTQDIIKPPHWCEVGLRDGNQSLPNPMIPEQKLAYFEEMVRIGFKQIEVGFPSASQTDFDFCRKLIEEDLIPDDVYIQVLVQCREDLIKRTCEAIQGAPNAILHFYSSTNPTQRRHTFRNMSQADNIKMAVDGAKMVRQHTAPFAKGMNDLVFQYSPESWSDTEPDHGIEVCKNVMQIIEPTEAQAMILNIPVTVERRLSTQTAALVEYFCQEIPQRTAAIVSMHAHNDCGTGVSTTEMATLAGADRSEGCVFGVGERTGNEDLLIAAANLASRGVNPLIDLSDIPRTRRIYEETTGMVVPDRHPYAGDLVFTAFSGSHQDALKKGFEAYDKALKIYKSALADFNRTQTGTAPVSPVWQEFIQYLHIDPTDFGKKVEFIVVNSQSGKAGTAFILKNTYGFDAPKALQSQIHTTSIQPETEKSSKSISPEEIWTLFEEEFMNHDFIQLNNHILSTINNTTNFSGNITIGGVEKSLFGQGSGPISAFVHALRNSNSLEADFSIGEYGQEMDLREKESGAEANAYGFVELKFENNGSLWGVGHDENTDTANIKAVLSSINRYMKIASSSE